MTTCDGACFPEDSTTPLSLSLTTHWAKLRSVADAVESSGKYVLLLKEAAGRCVRCGSTACLVEMESVLKLFFVPVKHWPGKAPGFYCRDCSFLSLHSLPLDNDDRGAGGRGLFESIRCRSCRRNVYLSFRFCPFCGYQL